MNLFSGAISKLKDSTGLDLGEFASQLRDDTTELKKDVKEVAGNLHLGEHIANASRISTTVLSQTASLIGATAEHDGAVDTSGRAAPHTGAGGGGAFSRHQERLRALRSDPQTFTTEPADGEAFKRWSEAFSLLDHSEAIQALLRACPEVHALHAKHVPASVPYRTFWERYYYRVHKLEVEEARRQEAIARATAAGGGGAADGGLDLDWGDNDDADDLTGAEGSWPEAAADAAAAPPAAHASSAAVEAAVADPASGIAAAAAGDGAGAEAAAGHAPSGTSGQPAAQPPSAPPRGAASAGEKCSPPPQPSALESEAPQLPAAVAAPTMARSGDAQPAGAAAPAGPGSGPAAARESTAPQPPAAHAPAAAPPPIFPVAEPCAAAPSSAASSPVGGGAEGCEGEVRSMSSVSGDHASVDHSIVSSVEASSASALEASGVSSFQLVSSSEADSMEGGGHERADALADSAGASGSPLGHKAVRAPAAAPAPPHGGAPGSAPVPAPPAATSAAADIAAPTSAAAAGRGGAAAASANDDDDDDWGDWS